MQRTTKREELELFAARTPIESQGWFVRSLNASKLETKERVEETETFLSEDWLNAENDSEVTAAITYLLTEIYVYKGYRAEENWIFPEICSESEVIFHGEEGVVFFPRGKTKNRKKKANKVETWEAGMKEGLIRVNKKFGQS